MSSGRRQLLLPVKASWPIRQVGLVAMLSTPIFLLAIAACLYVPVTLLSLFPHLHFIYECWEVNSGNRVFSNRIVSGP